MNPFLSLLLRVPLHALGLMAAGLPRSWELPLGRGLGRLGLALDRKRRRIVEENLERCLPERTPAERARVLRENYEHYGILTFELLHMFAPIPGHWPAYVRRVARLEGFEHWAAANARGRGTLVCSGHFANWELMAAAGAMAGIPLTIVTRHLKPEWFHRWMEKTRLSTGVSCAYQPRTMPAVMRGLRDGRAVGFVLDQYMPPPMGEKMLFFGASVSTLAAVAPLARRTGAAVLPVRQRRLPDGVVLITIEPEFELGSGDREDNQRLASLIEDWIRDRPGEWLWAHRRFKDAVWPSSTDRHVSSLGNRARPA